MPDTTEPFEVEVSGEIYKVMHEEDEGGLRTCIYSRGQLRFSLPESTPYDEMRKFVQVYAIGFEDGQTARSTALGDHIRGRFNLVARRLGQSVGKLKGSAQ
jgi:hypothetical protein